mgnify:CR=1 FL=1
MSDDVAGRVKALLTELFPLGIPTSSYQLLTRHLPSLQALVELSLSSDKLPGSPRCQLRVLPVIDSSIQSSPLKHEVVDMMRLPLTPI